MARRPKVDLSPERFLAVVAYDGTDYVGWQVQPNGQSVQAFIEARLSRIFKRPVDIVGSGRTDSGVHSEGQCFHFDAFWPHPASALLRALRSGEPGGILVRSLRRVPGDFHARYSAKGKRYRYEMCRGHPLPWDARYCLALGDRKLDIPAMRRAAKLLLGRHDFSAFGANHGQSMENENPVKDLRRLDIRVRGPRITVTTEASGYLYKMVRRLVGSLVEIGCGNASIDDLTALLTEPSASKPGGRLDPARVTAPPSGLFLEEIVYRP